MKISPSSSRQFLKVARQRLSTAEFLLRQKYNLDAMYLGGYAIECSLKALILEATAAANRQATLAKITRGASMHEVETLKAVLNGLGQRIPLEIVKRLRRSSWSSSLRYATGRTDTGETRAFLKTAKLVYDWVEAKLP